MADRLAPLGYYKWHWQSWRANRKVQRMSYIERGIYRELLDECWAEGFIPDDIEKLADICGCPTEVMANAWQVLSKCFANAGNGFLYNERLEQERTDMDRTRANRARAGAAGGRAKATNGAGSDGNSLANASKCQANASNSHIEEKRREEKSKEKEKSNGSTFVPPLWLDIQLWDDFIDMRKKIKKPATERAKQLLVNELEKLLMQGYSQQEIISNSIKNCWQDFYAPKNSGNNRGFVC